MVFDHLQMTARHARTNEVVVWQVCGAARVPCQDEVSFTAVINACEKGPQCLRGSPLRDSQVNVLALSASNLI